MTRLIPVLLLASVLISPPAAAQRISDLPQSLSLSPTRYRDSAPVSSVIRWSDTVATAPAVRHKSPFLAWFLSWLVPGGGQGYNGQWTKAAAFFLPAVVGFALAASNDGFDCTGDCGTRDLGLGILILSSVGSQIEAPIAASKINRDAKKAATPQVSVTLGRLGF